MNNIAIITARGGSKRIPKKNIREFCGKPIIAYTIEAALKASLFETVMVSTDSREIADIAKQYGAEVPFFRSRENSDDYAVTADVVAEVLDKYETMGKGFDIGCCLYPTAPFIEPDDLKKAYNEMVKSKADCTVCVTRFSFPPQRGCIIKDNVLKYMQPENYEKRSQDLEPVYHDTGQFYFFRSQALKREKRMILKNNVPYIMDEMRVQDIDNEDDWEIARMKYLMLMEQKRNGRINNVHTIRNPMD